MKLVRETQTRQIQAKERPENAKEKRSVNALRQYEKNMFMIKLLTSFQS